MSSTRPRDEGWFLSWMDVTVPMYDDTVDFEALSPEQWEGLSAEIEAGGPEHQRWTRNVQSAVSDAMWQVRGSDWLRPSGLTVAGALAFVEHDDGLPSVRVGRRRKDDTVEVRVVLNYHQAATQPVAAVARTVVGLFLEGFERLAKRYALPPFPAEQLPAAVRG